MTKLATSMNAFGFVGVTKEIIMLNTMKHEDSRDVCNKASKQVGAGDLLDMEPLNVLTMNKLAQELGWGFGLEKWATMSRILALLTRSVSGHIGRGWGRVESERWGECCGGICVRLPFMYPRARA